MSTRSRPWMAYWRQWRAKSAESEKATSSTRSLRMDPGLRTSASGMKAQQLMVDAIANNLANVNTTGFKRSRVSFEDVLYETLEGARTVNPNDSQTIAPVQIGKGVRLAAIMRLHTQ